MARRVACRYYDPPGIWCGPCRSGHPERCLEPIIAPDRAVVGFLLRPEISDAGAIAAREAAADQTHLALLAVHSLGCILLGAGVAALFTASPVAAGGLVLLALGLGGLALNMTRGAK